MPIHVQCPNGCRLRVPRKRAGTVITCPECQQKIRLGPLSQVVTTSESRELQPPAANASSAELELKQSSEEIASEPPVDHDWKQLEDSLGGEPLPTRLADRANRARNDRVVVSRLLACALCVVALINLAPAVWAWLHWSQSSRTTEPARWVYLLALIAAFHFMYAVYLAQIPDWSALRMVALFCLGLSVLFGTVSTALVVGNGGGPVDRFLELPTAMTQRGSIWCVAMLCLATLISYLCGREAENWRRSEQLLAQILHSRVPEEPSA